MIGARGHRRAELPADSKPGEWIQRPSYALTWMTLAKGMCLSGLLFAQL